MNYDNIMVKELAGKEVTLFFLGKPCLGNLVDVIITLPDIPDPAILCKEIGHMWTWMPKSHHACLRCGAYEENVGAAEVTSVSPRHAINVTQ